MNTKRIAALALVALPFACSTTPSNRGAPSGSTSASFAGTDASHVRAVFSAVESKPPQRTATVLVPIRADGATSLEDDTSHVATTFRVLGARPVAAIFRGHEVVYDDALYGASLQQRVSLEGTEDFVRFESRPDREEIVYDVDVSRVPGLRLVENTLELLDRDGVPRLRVAPPWLADASGARHDASLELSLCSFDRVAAAPWGRAITPPGSTHCRLSVRWHSEHYPVTVDPVWSTTGAMSVGRYRHTATVLASGNVLVAGGYNGTADTPAAEIYDPAAGVFAVTGSLGTAREFHTQTVLKSGKVLVAGGTSGGTALSSAELYDPATGTFAATGTMTVARHAHVAALLSTGKVLLAGGQTTLAMFDTTAELYDPSAGTFAATGSLTVGMGRDPAVTLPSGQILVIPAHLGGSVANVYDPAAGTFSATKSFFQSYADETATVLASGSVLVTGGSADGSSTNLQAATLLYDPVANTVSNGRSLTTARAGHTATPLVDGKVLIEGGSSDTTEVYDPATGFFTATTSMSTSRQYETATRLSNGAVLIIGGKNGTAALDSAEIYSYDAAGFACTSSDQCASGFCVDGVCCDSSCASQCGACDEPGHVGTCVAVSGAPHGTRPKCDGSGPPCGLTCDGTTLGTCTYPTALCGSTCNDAHETDSLCDGAGNCVVQPPHACSNLICADATKCKASCASDDDCVSGYSCGSESTCVPGATCSDDKTSVDSSGKPTDCTPYKCATSGACLQTCTSVNDCVAPNVCGSDGKCAAAPTGDSGGCHVADGSIPGAEWLAVLPFVVVRRRRRRSTS